MSTTVTREKIERRIFDVLVDLEADPDQIDPDAMFEDLGIDSLDMVELAEIIQDEYGVKLTGEDLATLETVGQAVELVVERAGAGTAPPRQAAQATNTIN